MKKIRLLTIGNSFSICLGKDLPQLAASIPGCVLEFTSAYIGGCSLERHWNNVLATQANPEARQYVVDTWVATPAHGIANIHHTAESINSLIEKDCWDIITIQQASHFSWKPETYQPFGDNLVAYIREKAPHAEIRVQQTWAYRTDDARLKPGSEWGIDQLEMHKRLTAAYTSFAKHIGAKIIPTGWAVHFTRDCEVDPFREPTKKEKAACRWPDLPIDSGDVVGRIYWRKNAEGSLELGTDTIHLNRRGEYLQACVWFLSLFDRITIPAGAYVPNDIDDDDAIQLRQCATLAIGKTLHA